MQGMMLLASGVILISVTACASFVLKNTGRRILLLIAGIFTSAVLLFVPLYIQTYSLFSSLLFSLLKSMQMFVLNSSYSDLPASIDTSIRPVYSLLLGVLHIAAPILTVAVILSLISDRIRVLRSHIPFRRKYVFSDISEKSLTLARSLKKSISRPLVVFSNTAPASENTMKFMEEIEENRFIPVKRTVDAIYRKSKHRRSEIHYFLLSEDENRNLGDLLKMTDQNPDDPKVFYYVFSNDAKSEILVNTIASQNRNIKLVNEKQTAAYRLLEESPVYRHADESGKDPSVLLLGLGDFGIEILKAMAWCCTSAKYKPFFMILDNNIRERIGIFKRSCPALLLDRYNIRYHDENVDFRTDALHKFLAENGLDYDYIVVSTGDDDVNLSTALELEEQFGRSGKSPAIHVMVRDDQKSALFKKYQSGSGHELCFFGSRKDICRCDAVLNDASDLLAMVIHQVYSGMDKKQAGVFTKESAMRDWNLLTSVKKRSNKALALHLRYRLREQGCLLVEDQEETAGLDYLDDVLKDDLLRYAKLEHERWNAYMLTEGWHPLDIREAIAAGRVSRPEFRQHACITDWDNLARIDRAFHQDFMEYDKNFILKTGDILHIYNNISGHHLRIVRMISAIEK